MSYGNGDDTTSWVIDNGSTHHINGFGKEFLTMTLEGYDDGALVKGLTSGTNAYGIGTCIVALKDSVGSFHQKCLEDVLYVLNLLHYHPSIFSVISSTCSQNECQCYFQTYSYVLDIKLAKVALHWSKGLLWIPTIDSFIVPHFVSVIFRIRDACLNTMFLVLKGSDNTISILVGYVRDNEGHVECGFRFVKSLLEIRLEIRNQLCRRHSSIILLDVANPFHNHTYQGEFWLEELQDGVMC